MKKLVLAAAVLFIVSSCQQNTEGSVTRITQLEEKIKQIEAEMQSMKEKHEALNYKLSECTVSLGYIKEGKAIPK